MNDDEDEVWAPPAEQIDDDVLEVLGAWAEELENRMKFRGHKATYEELRAYAEWWANCGARCDEVNSYHAVTLGRRRCPHGLKG